MPSAKKVNIQNIYFVAVIVIIVAVLVMYFPTQQTGNTNPTIEQQIIQELSQRSEIKAYVDYPATVRFLSADQLDRLKAEQPAIYGDVPANVYEIDYDGTPIGKETGLLVIYNFDTKTIVKMFVVQNFAF